MRKKTLMFYINAIHEGGAERVIIQLSKHFSENEYNSVLVTSFIDDNEYSVPNGVERLSIETKQIKQNIIIKNIRRIIALRKLIKTYSPDAIISFMAEPNFRAIIASLGTKTKTIISVRNDPSKEYTGKMGRWISKYILPLADGCVFQTEEAKKWFPISLQKKSQIIMNDVDPVFFETEYSGGNDIITLGRLCEQKNHKLLIDAFVQIAERHKHVNLLIYGIGPLEDELRKYILNCNMETRIFLKGLTSESNSVLSKARCFVLSSDYEGMPNALLEALAIGVPSISTDCPCGGPRMLIKDGVNGILVPIKDSNILAEKIGLLLSNSEMAEKLSVSAKKMSKVFRTENVFIQWKKYIENTISNKTK